MGAYLFYLFSNKNFIALWGRAWVLRCTVHCNQENLKMQIPKTHHWNSCCASMKSWVQTPAPPTKFLGFKNTKRWYMYIYIIWMFVYICASVYIQHICIMSDLQKVLMIVQVPYIVFPDSLKLNFTNLLHSFLFSNHLRVNCRQNVPLCLNISVYIHWEKNFKVSLVQQPKPGYKHWCYNL
jgi:hypothetical protein